MSIQWARPDSFLGNCTWDGLTYYRPCPICASLRYQPILEVRDFQFYTDSGELPKRATVRQNLCLHCSTLFLNPCYSEAGFRILFAEAGQSYGSAEGRPSEQIDWMRSRNLLRPGTTVLDAGCYDGQFLARLPSSVVRVGVDVDDAAIARARRQFGRQGIEFVSGTLDGFTYSGTVDTITMFHVLEHMSRPVSVLQRMRSISHPETRLTIEVPILEKGITQDVNGFFSVQHVTHFSKCSLRNCVRRSGWTIVEEYDVQDYNAFRVMVAPGDADGKVARDDGAVDALYAYLSGWYSALRAINARLLDLRQTPRCVIWGGGVHTELLYHTTTLFHSTREREFAIVDRDPAKHGKTWRGITIHSPDVLREVDWAEAQLLVSSYGSQLAIEASAAAAGVPQERVVTLYDNVRAY